jgi:2-O-methyltransferase
MSFLRYCETMLVGCKERRYEGKDPSWREAESVEKRLEILAQFLPLNPTIFEAGAYDGSDSVKMAKQWPLGKVLSFEPNPRSFVSYQKNVRGLPNVQGYPLALQTYNGYTKLYLSGDKMDLRKAGASSVLEPLEHANAEYVEVPCVMFESWCSEQDIQEIDFMWLDMEGFELPFLKSSSFVLKTVKVIYTETNFRSFRKETTFFDSLRKFLEANGFELMAHWYAEGVQGDAIFLRTSSFANYYEQALV